MPFDGAYFFPMDEVLFTVRRGRERVARSWTQGKLFDDLGRVCAVGAVTDPDDLRFMTAPATRALYAALPLRWKLVAYLRLLEPGEAVIMFNDAPWRTRARIVRLFNRAIRLREWELVT